MELYQKINSDVVVKKMNVKGNVYVQKDAIFISDKKLKNYNNVYKDVNGEINVDGDLYIEGNILFKDITFIGNNTKIKVINSKFDNILNSSRHHIKCENFVILDNMYVDNDVIFFDSKFLNRIRRLKIKKLKNN